APEAVMKLCFLAGLLLLVAVPANAAKSAGSTDEEQIIYLQQVDSAIRQGRLTQAGQMIAALESAGTNRFPDDFALLKAEYAIARMDVKSASFALSAIQDPARNLCRMHAAKGWVSANQNAFNSAVDALSVATEHCPDDAGIWNLFGLALIGKGEAATAQKAFEHALALDPGNAQLINNHALASLQDGDVERALRELDSALALNPHDPMIKANRNFAAGMTGLSPERTTGESDADWSAKLLQYAKGAKSASRGTQATAFFARAMLTLERFDEAIWSELYPESESPL
ncbi:MAG: tetratricopeptide repeat protein, partial [Pseudomonadota bacterium]